MIEPSDEKTIKDWVKSIIYETMPTRAFKEEEPMAEMELKTGEKEFEVGKDEAWFANIKRSYDLYQDFDAVEKRRSQDNYDRLNQIAAQALQNAVESANMTAKQAIKHADVAADAMWNPIEAGAGNALVARAVTIDDASLKAIGAVVAAAVANALGKVV